MKRIFASVVVGLMLLSPFSMVSAYEDGDWQYWNTESVQGKLTDNLKAYVEAEFRFGDDASKFYYQHTHLELKYKVNDWFEIAPANRQVYELYTKSTTEDDWYTEYRPMLNGTINWKWADWKFSNRARIEYRMYDINKDDVWRFRDKIVLKSPWKWTPLEINPFISGEIFITENKDGIYRNRLYAGVGMKLFEHVKGEVFYLWQTEDKGDEWKDTNVIGTKLKVVF